MIKIIKLRTLSTILVLILVFSSLASCYRIIPNDTMLDPNSVSSRLGAMEDVPEFDKKVFASVENCFVSMYYKKLPDNETLAEGTKAAYFEFCSEVDPTSITEVTYSLIDCYIYTIGDKYAFYRSPEEFEEYTGDMSGSFVGIGVSVLRNDLEKTIFVNSVEPGSPAFGAGILPDDYIVAVNGKRVLDIGTLEAVNMIKGEEGTEVTVTIDRAGEEISFTMVRAKITETTVSYSVMEEENVGYVKITSFKANTASQFFKAINALEEANVKGIIFDVRRNPGGYLTAVTDILSYLVPTGTPIASFSSSKAPINATNGGIFETDDHTLKVPSVVICNETSASAAELFTAAMRDYNDMGLLKSTVIGVTTYKKGVMQSTYEFNDGSSLTFTTALYNPPSGENFNDVGVIPDVIVEDDGERLNTALSELIKLIENN
ncbi:MAG: S41 family peptidase [Clostridia bacterium]|nr:S41 family peptidase [Clostridia bacterium]